LGMPALTCQVMGIPSPPRAEPHLTRRTLSLPMGLVIAIPGGPLVMVGGPPTISLMVFAMKGIFSLLGAAFRKACQKFKNAIRKALDNNPKCKAPGHPIDPVTGAYFDSFVDFEVDAPCPLQWKRPYTSLDAGRAGPLGPGFRHPLEQRLFRAPSGLAYEDLTGAVVVFETPLPGERSVCNGLSIEPSARGGYLLCRPQGSSLEFFEDPRRAGHWRLGVWRERDAEWTLDYDGLGRLTEARQHTPAGQVVLRFMYSAQGRLCQVLARRPEGEQLLARYEYDAAGRLVRSVGALGAVTQYRYDTQDRQIGFTDPRGYSFRFAYDEAGRCTGSWGEDGLWGVRLEYLPEKLQTRVIEHDGGEWLWTYDAMGTVTSVMNPLGGVLRREVSPTGRVTAEITPDGERMEWLYTPEGELAGRMDRFGHLLPPWDDDPNPPSPFDVPLASTPRAFRLGDAQGPPGLDLTSVLPGFVQEEAAAALRPEPQPDPSRERVERDALGRVVAYTDGLGRTERLELDACGNVVARVDRDGAIWRNEVTRWNLIGATIDPNGARTAFAYDDHENVTRITDPNGVEVGYRYDTLDRLVEVTRLGRSAERYAWDAHNRVIRREHGASAWGVTHEVGRDGLFSARVLSTGERHTLAGDKNAWIARADAPGQRVDRAHTPDGLRLHDLRAGEGVAHRYDGPTHTTSVLGLEQSWTLHPDGRRTLRLPDGREHTLTLSAQGQALFEAGATRALWRYDADGHLTGQVVWSPKSTGPTLWWTRAELSAEGEVRHIEDSERGRTQPRYDAAHRLQALERPGEDPLPLTLDLAGNLLVSARGERQVIGPGNRLVASGQTHFAYNDQDAITEANGPEGRAFYRYDGLNRLVELRWEGREERFTAVYDGLSRRVEKRMGDQVTRYWWDGDRLAAEEDPKGRLRVYVYADHDALSPIAFVDYPRRDAPPSEGRLHLVFTDTAGLPIRVEDQDGDIVWRAAKVHPYGLIDVDPRSHIEYALRWPGHVYDPETGLHDNRFRSYSPTWGRYLQSDPKGQDGGVNLYAYCPNPLVQVDVLGLSCGKANGGGGEGGTTKGDAPASHSKSSTAGTTGGAPDFVVTPKGEVIAVPKGSKGPIDVVNPQGKTTGFAFIEGSGGPGLDKRVTSVRIMDPTTPKGSNPGYPGGYVKYQNAAGQAVDSTTGKTVSNADPKAHIPLEPP
jgi:RHS repeat-associated protein